METTLIIKISKKDAEKINPGYDLCAYVDKKLKRKFIRKVKKHGL
jgi:hypothetical protein